MSEYVRTVTTNTSQEDTLTSAKEIAASLEEDGLFVTIGDPYTDHTTHSDPEEQRHRVDLTVSTKPPTPAAVAEDPAPPAEPVVEEPVEEPPVTEPPVSPETETAP